MKILIASANLGNFDTPKDPIGQVVPHGVTEIKFHRFTDENFPPVAGLTPRLQYRLAKMFTWDFKPGYDIYLFYDASMSLQRPDSLDYFLEQLGDADMALFKHPVRRSMRQEVDHIEEKLQQGNKYITPRYGGGFHEEFLRMALPAMGYNDHNLWASTMLIYRNNEAMREALRMWYELQARYWTCDQVHLPYVVDKLGIKVNTIQGHVFKDGYISLIGHHS